VLARSTIIPFSNLAPARTRATRWRVDRPPSRLGGFDELEGHGEAGDARPGPLVSLARCRTVAKVDSIGLVVLRWIQTFTLNGGVPSFQPSHGVPNALL
jgi:hypothetical protein